MCEYLYAQLDKIIILQLYRDTEITMKFMYLSGSIRVTLYLITDIIHFL